MVIELGIQNEVDFIRSSDEWQNSDFNKRVAMLNEYEDILETQTDENYDGGFKQWSIDNKEFIEYLDDARKREYNNSMEQIESVRDQWFSEWADKFTNPDGKGLLRGYVQRIGEGMWSSVGHMAKAFGFDEAAEDYYNNAKLIGAGWDEMANGISEAALSAEEDGGLPV